MMDISQMRLYLLVNVSAIIWILNNKLSFRGVFYLFAEITDAEVTLPITSPCCWSHPLVDSYACNSLSDVVRGSVFG